MIGARRSAGLARARGDFRASSATCGGFAPSSYQASYSRSCQATLALARRSCDGVAKARRAQPGFGRATAHIPGFAAPALHVVPAPVSCRAEQLSQKEGVLSCGQSSIHSGWRFARVCRAAVTQPASRRSTARAPARLGPRCCMAIWSLVQPSVQLPMSSIAKKTPANAEGALPLSRLSCQPIWVAQDIHANAAAEPCAQLRRSAFRHTKEQGTANV